MTSSQRIVFRTDASHFFGTGHLMRCLALADELQRSGCEIGFVCRDLPGGLFPLIESKGYLLVKLSGQGVMDWTKDAADTINQLKQVWKEIDWLVVDHYELDSHWESSLRANAKNIMVIDDLANRLHDCDLLLDQNYYSDHLTRYDTLVPENCKKLLGPRFALLRPEFEQAREKLRERNGGVRRIMVFFGGSDPENLTATAIEAIVELARPDISTDVVVGASNPYRFEILELCEQTSGFSFHLQVSNMAKLIAAADLSLCAGGATMWERCFLGLPSITVIFADNQERTTLDVAKKEAIMCLGWANKLDHSDYTTAIRDMIANPDKMLAMSKNALRLMGGSGYQGTVAVAEAML